MAQLKIMREVISLLVAVPFAVLYLGAPPFTPRAFRFKARSRRTIVAAVGQLPSRIVLAQKPTTARFRSKGFGVFNGLKQAR